ncbi:MAG: phage tail protein, partial [Pedobacter sp.]
MEPYLGELKIFPYNFAPKDWAQCNGQLLQIASNQPLFSLLGTRYGGNGVTTFGLPNLQGRSPVHANIVGQPTGKNKTTLTVDNLAPHSHTLNASTSVIDVGPATNNFIGAGTDFQFAAGKNVGAAMSTEAVGKTGGNVPVDNMQPYLAINYSIA